MQRPQKPQTGQLRSKLEKSRSPEVLRHCLFRQVARRLIKTECTEAFPAAKERKQSAGNTQSVNRERLLTKKNKMEKERNTKL